GQAPQNMAKIPEKLETATLAPLRAVRPPPSGSATSVAGRQHGGDETEQVRMQEQRVVPDLLLKEEVARAGFSYRYAGRHPDRRASGSVQQGTTLGLDPAVGLDS